MTWDGNEFKPVEVIRIAIEIDLHLDKNLIFIGRIYGQASIKEPTHLDF